MRREEKDVIFMAIARSLMCSTFVYKGMCYRKLPNFYFDVYKVHWGNPSGVVSDTKDAL